MLFAWLMSLIATLGSLYFSQVQKFEPCTLCWVQRIFMYPLVIILFVGIVRKDKQAAWYSILLSGIGLCISAYHYTIQKLSFFSEITPSCGRVPCTGEYINWLGFITIPFLAGTAFTIIFICSLLILKQNEEATQL